MEALAASLDAALPRAVRARPIEDGVRHQGFLLEAGVSICVSAQPLDIALTAFFAQGMLPEWPLLLYCSRQTTWEEVSNLLHRWATFEIPQRVCCLCGIDALSAAVSHELSSALLQNGGNSGDGSGSALLLVTRSAEHHLVRQLGPFRVTILPSPRWAGGEGSVQSGDGERGEIEI